MSGISITGLGVFLPTNIDRIQETSIDASQASSIFSFESGRHERPAKTEGERVMKAIVADNTESSSDVGRARHILPMDEDGLHMEVEAARAAMADAAVAPGDVDFVLSYSMVPDFLTTNGAVAIHHALGLPERSMALEVGAVSNSFLMQLGVADALTTTGHYECGLLVQSTLVTRLMAPDEPRLNWFGNAATATVVQRAPGNAGLLSIVHRADGRYGDAFATTVPGKRWYDDGRLRWYATNPESVQGLISALADRAAGVVKEALRESGLDPKDVHAFACYQGMRGFLDELGKHCGLAHAVGADTFALASNVLPCNVPLGLHCLKQRGLLGEGSVVVMFAGGAGDTWSAAVLRWSK